MARLSVCVPGKGKAGGGSDLWGQRESVYIFFSVIAQVEA